MKVLGLHVMSRATYERVLKDQYGDGYVKASIAWARFSEDKPEEVYEVGRRAEAARRGDDLDDTWLTAADMIGTDARQWRHRHVQRGPLRLVAVDGERVD